MKIAVVGAGVSGVATALELVERGHEVVVFERTAAAAQHASFAPGALMSPAWAVAWADPPRRLGARWRSPGSAVRWAAGADLSLWRWWRRWQGSEWPGKDHDTQQALAALATLSAERHTDLNQSLGLELARTDGMLVLLHEAADRERGLHSVDRLRALGLPARLVDADTARAIEPALNPSAALDSAVLLEGPSAANCREWTLQVRQHAIGRGVHFEMPCTVHALEPHAGGWLVQAARDGQAPSPWAVDAVVLCAGADAAARLRHLGLHLGKALRPLWSQSLSAPVLEPMDSPVHAVFDARQRVGITRLGQWLRAAGGATLGAAGHQPEAAVQRWLSEALQHWFPAAARLHGPRAALQGWRGAQVMSTDGLPLLGPTRLPGLSLNLGHGARGWALACGAATRVADAFEGRPTTGHDERLSPQRFGL